MAGTCGYGEGLLGSISAGNFLNSCKVYWLASQEELCSMEYESKKQRFLLPVIQESINSTIKITIYFFPSIICSQE